MLKLLEFEKYMFYSGGGGGHYQIIAKKKRKKLRLQVYLTIMIDKTYLVANKLTFLSYKFHPNLTHRDRAKTKQKLRFFFFRKYICQRRYVQLMNKN